MHRVHELAATRRAGHPFEPMVGRVDSLQASGGGVPKTSIPVAEIGTGGLVGDVQHTRLHHGRPWQEVCLYSADVIAALRREGHPITPGGVGENVTISGIDWSRLRGGLTIAIAGRSGDVGNVRLRTTSPATPCHKIADCFTDRHWNRIHHGEQPGWARWYASVLTGGTIAPGDTVTITA
jgi:MOSC domain-containing protein YiiM